jgi:hypothetical protein
VLCASGQRGAREYSASASTAAHQSPQCDRELWVSAKRLLVSVFEVTAMASNPSPEPPLLADGHLAEDTIVGQTEASEVDSMEGTLHQMSMFRDYVPAQKRLMDRMNHILGEQHLKDWYSNKFKFVKKVNNLHVSFSK